MRHAKEEIEPQTDGKLLAVVVYRKGVRAIADLIRIMYSSKEAEDAA